MANSLPHDRHASGVPLHAVSHAALWVMVFFMGFVFIEPSPYELVSVIVMGGFFISGLTLSTSILPLVVCLLLFATGGFLSATQKADISEGLFYAVVSTFLVLTAVFYAALLKRDPEKRLGVIMHAYVAAAVVASLIGIFAYFRLIPSPDLFLKYGRASGPFKDPNVYGPYLILPVVYLARSILTQPLHRSAPSLCAMLIILFAVFLSFSRAAWGICILSIGMLSLVVFVSSDNGPLRQRIVMLTCVLAVSVAMLLAVALSLDSVSSLFSERAKIVQDYDTDRLGRFARHGLGFALAAEKPLGIGIGEFGKIFTEDPHNVYLKAFMAYGWLGGLSYASLVVMTLGFGFKNLFRPRPWQAIFQCCYIVFLCHAMLGLIIDIDRWRHVYLLYGVIWGVIGAEAMRVKPLPRSQFS